MTHRGKVFTVFTLLIINNLSVYTTPYIFCKWFTSLAVNDLSVYIRFFTVFGGIETAIFPCLAC